MSFSDIAIVLGIAAVGVAIVFFLFNSVAEVPKAKRAASQVVAAAKETKKEAEVKKPQPKQSKKEREAQLAKEKELEELIAREAVGTKGMASDKSEVITLEAVKAKAKAAKDSQRTKGTSEVKKEFTEEQKAKERAHGFKVVEAKEERKEAPAAVAASVQGAAKGHSGTRRASPTAPAASKREELEKKLGDFFKSGSRRRRDDDYAAKPTKSSPSPAERVKVAATKPSASAANKWAEEREW